MLRRERRARHSAGMSAGEPVVAGEIPLEAPAFQPRQALMDPLDQAGEVAGFSKYPVVCAVTGEPGVGKTQLVAAYARKRARAGWPVAWIHATNEDQVNATAGWDRFATALGASGKDIELFGSQWAARHQLERRLEPSLLVVEHATSPDWLVEWLPQRGRMQVVLNAGSAFTDVGEPVPVVPFTEPEALVFLRQRTGSDDEPGARAIAGELGRLPLALDLAAALIRGERLSYADYLDRLRDLPVDVHRADQQPAPPAGDPYSAQAARAILLSVRAAELADSTGLVTLLLDALSVLSPAGVAHWVLRNAVDTLAELPGRDEQAVATAIDTLAEARLLTRRAYGATTIVHRLVSRVLRDRARHAGRLTKLLADVLAAVRRALDSLPDADDPAWDERPKRERAHQLLDQVDALCAIPLGGAEPVPEPAERVLGLRRRCVRRLSEIEEHSRAIAAGTGLLADWERVAGADHPDTLTACQELAEAYWRYGDLGEAVDLFERTLADRERALGADHPDTLTSWYSLAVAYHDAWDLKRALGFVAEHHRLERHGEPLELYERALADRERAFAVGVLASDRYQHLLDDVRQAMRGR